MHTQPLSHGRGLVKYCPCCANCQLSQLCVSQIKPAKFITFNAEFRVFNGQFLVFDRKFISFTHATATRASSSDRVIP